jgi:hypothetical protein
MRSYVTRISMSLSNELKIELVTQCGRTAGNIFIHCCKTAKARHMTRAQSNIRMNFCDYANRKTIRKWCLQGLKTVDYFYSYDNLVPYTINWFYVIQMLSLS